VLTPGYGETPIPDDELEALLPHARQLLDEPVSKAALYDLYGDVWAWAGMIRTRELTIGIDPWQIAVELRSSLENIRYRWEHTDDWSPRQLGIAAHTEVVRIHPFTDGNWRSPGSSPILSTSLLSSSPLRMMMRSS
jgi:fido (protein-threonine AMPylation protein)